MSKKNSKTPAAAASSAASSSSSSPPPALSAPTPSPHAPAFTPALDLRSASSPISGLVVAGALLSSAASSSLAQPRPSLSLQPTSSSDQRTTSTVAAAMKPSGSGVFEREPSELSLAEPPATAAASSASSSASAAPQAFVRQVTPYPYGAIGAMASVFARGGIDATRSMALPATPRVVQGASIGRKRVSRGQREREKR